MILTVSYVGSGRPSVISHRNRKPGSYSLPPAPHNSHPEDSKIYPRSFKSWTVHPIVDCQLLAHGKGLSINYVIRWGRGGQNPGRYNVFYGQEYFKNLEKVVKIGKKMEANLKI